MSDERQELRSGLTSEAKRLYVDATYSSRGHFQEAKGWSQWSVFLGLPLVIVTAASAAGAATAATFTYRAAFAPCARALSSGRRNPLMLVSTDNSALIAGPALAVTVDLLPKGSCSLGALRPGACPASSRLPSGIRRLDLERSTSDFPRRLRCCSAGDRARRSQLRS